MNTVSSAENNITPEQRSAAAGMCGMDASCVYGYIRVSTREQNETRQLEAMRRVNVPKRNIFPDRQSDRNFDRPQYKRMLKKMKRDDLLYIKSIDRLGRPPSPLPDNTDKIK